MPLAGTTACSISAARPTRAAATHQNGSSRSAIATRKKVQPQIAESASSSDHSPADIGMAWAEDMLAS
jgi:hypothetical protein